MSYETIWEENGIMWVFNGALTDNDLLECNMNLYADPRFSVIKYQIADLSAVESLPIDTSTVRRVAEMDAKNYSVNPDIKVAIIANKTVITGLVNLYESYFELFGDNKTWEIEIFDTIEAARQWLNSFSSTAR